MELKGASSRGLSLYNEGIASTFASSLSSPSSSSSLIHEIPPHETSLHEISLHEDDTHPFESTDEVQHNSLLHPLPSFLGSTDMSGASPAVQATHTTQALSDGSDEDAASDASVLVSV